jgi:hypothetical protein
VSRPRLRRLLCAGLLVLFASTLSYDWTNGAANAAYVGGAVASASAFRGTDVSFTTTAAALHDPASSYVLEDFRAHPGRIVNQGRGTTIVAAGAATITTAANTETLWSRRLWSAILAGYDTITLEVNLNGFEFSRFSDSPIFYFSDTNSSRRGINLLNYVENGSPGWQIVSVPLTKFTTGYTSTAAAPGTGAPLNANAEVSEMGLRIYNASAAQQLSMRSIVVSDSRRLIRQDYSQPSFQNSPKRASATWPFQGLDLMKVTKDNLRNQVTPTTMLDILKSVKALNPTHVSVSTPYDAPSAYPYPQPSPGYAQKWAAAIRSSGYNVFWRQSPLEWEGMYGVPKDTSRGVGTAAGVLNGTESNTYLAQIYSYIRTNAQQYAAGDIIAPIPEPENGGINGVNGASPYQFEDAEAFRRWLRDAITVTNAALRSIGLYGQVHVGWYGVSGFMAIGNRDNTNGFLDDRTLDAMGVLGMDHYPGSVTALATDLGKFESLYGQRPLVITEWGTINESTDAARIAATNSYLSTLATKPYVYGFSYWTPIGAGDSNANENIIDHATYAPIGAYNALRTVFNTGSVAASSAPTLTTSSGQPGEIRWDSGYLYLCIAPNTWKRAPLSDW